MRIAVTGGRYLTDADLVFRTLDEINRETPIEVVIHGAARGADSLAATWAAMTGVPDHAHPANWERDGRAAGPIRNRLMLLKEKPDLLVAFPGGAGTAHCRSCARELGIKVREVAR